MPEPYCRRCVLGGTAGAHSEACDNAAAWIAVDLPAMRRVVRAENPDWTPAQVAVEAIRRLG